MNHLQLVDPSSFNDRAADRRTWPHTSSCAVFLLAVALAVAGTTAADQLASGATAPRDVSAQGAAGPPRAASPNGLRADFIRTTPPGAEAGSTPALSPSEARSRVKPGDRVTLIGRVGGSVKPFVDGRAIMTIVDSSLPSCADRPGDNCTRPWDYCCETRQEIASRSATLQVLDERGAPLRVDLKGVGGITELSEVTVEGTVSAVGDRVLVLTAERVYVNPEIKWSFFLRERPEDAQPVQAVAARAPVGEKVTIVGRVGTSGFETARAIFTVIDPSVRPCGGLVADACTAPAACSTHEGALSAELVASVRVVGVDGKPLALDLRGRRGLSPGAEVIVQGTVRERGGTSAVVVDAERVFVAPPAK